MATQYDMEEELAKRGASPGIASGQTVNPNQWVQDTGRQSYHYATIPDAYKNIPGFTDVANDPSQDPGKFAQDYLEKKRGQGLTDSSDAAALGGQGFLGGAPPSQLPKNATPAQQWNAQPAPAAATTTATPAVQQSASTAGRDALFEQLMARARQSTAVSADDPTIKAQVDPYVAQQTRASREYLAKVAEQQGPLGNIGGEQRMAAEKLGQNSGLFEAELIGREIKAKRDEVADALQLATQMGNSSAVLEMQEKLKLLDNQARDADRIVTQHGQEQDYSLAQQGYGIQRLGLDNQRYGQDQAMEQFLRELALREWTATDQSDQDWARLGG